MLGARKGQSTRAATTAALTGAAVALAVVAGCGTARADQPGTPPGQASHVPVPTPRTGPAAGSAKQAQRLAGEMLSHLMLPAGAHRIPWHPPPALRQTSIALGVRYQADVRELWQVPASMTALARYIRAHPPAGLPFQGSGRTFSRSQIDSQETTFFLRRVPAGIQSATLTLEIAPAGQHRSTLRADAEVIWYPPRSTAEYLVPSRFGAVTVAAGFLSPKPHIVRRTFTTPSVIARLARFLNGLRATPGGLMGCPAVTATYSVTFRHAADAPPYLTASINGCGTVGILVNGRTQPGLVDPGGLITRAVQAALAGHPASIAPAPGPTTPAPEPVISPATPPAVSP